MEAKSGPGVCGVCTRPAKCLYVNYLPFHYILEGMVEGGKRITHLEQPKHDRTPTKSNFTSCSTSVRLKYKLRFSGNANRPGGHHESGLT
jgi:hypothetical protein